MKTDKPIPLVLATDDHYFPFLAATLQSVMENSDPTRSVRVYVLFQSVSMQRWESLQDQIRQFPHFSYEAVDVSSQLQPMDFPNMHFTALTYARLLIPYLPIPFEQVVYLDCDTICLGNIGDVLDASSQDCLLNAVKDVGILQNGYDYTSLLGLTEHGNYFNAGVLVFNTSRIRNNIPREKMLRMAVSQRWEYADQCMLNVLCENQVNFLPFSWNVMTGARCNNLPGGLAREYGLSQKRPNIIHYVWDKPWQQFYITPRTRPFWEYASQTPFATEIYSRLVESNLATADITSETMRDMFVRYNRREMDVVNKSLRQWVKRRLLPET